MKTPPMMTFRQSTKKSKVIPISQMVRAGAAQIANATRTFAMKSPPVSSETTAVIGSTIFTGHSIMYQRVRNALLSSFSIDTDGSRALRFIFL
jgi:hypothetical protein